MSKRARTDRRLTESPPDESVGALVDADAEMQELCKKTELWAAAKAKLATRGRILFDTSGLSAHGIVPRLHE